MLTEGKRKKNERKSEQPIQAGGKIQSNPSRRENDYHYVIELESAPTTAQGSDYSADRKEEANNTNTNYIVSTLANLANTSDVKIHKKYKKDNKQKMHKKKKKDKKGKKDKKYKKDKKNKKDKKDKKDKKEKGNKKDKKKKKHTKEKKNNKDTDMEKAKL